MDDRQDDDGDARDAALVTEAQVACPVCGVMNEIRLDPAAGATQDYVEDCEVCCQPWRVSVRFDDTGEADVAIEPAQ